MALAGPCLEGLELPWLCKSSAIGTRRMVFTPETPVDIEVAVQAEDLRQHPSRFRRASPGEIGKIAG